MTAPSAQRARDVGDVARIFYGLATAALIGFIAWVGRDVLIPLIVAGFLCFLIYTLKEQVKQAPLIGRRLPNWLCYFVAFAVIAGVFLVLLSIIRQNVEAVSAAAPLYEANLKRIAGDALSFVERSGLLPTDIMTVVQELQTQAIGMITPALRNVGAALRSTAASSVTIFLYTVFMLVERGRIFRKINILSGSGAQRKAVDETIDEIARMVRQYISVKTVSNLVVAAAAYASLTLIGVDFAGFWALLIFILNFIPIVGAFLGILGPVLLALVQPDGGGLQLALLALVLIVAADQVMSSVIEPRLMGKSLNLSPLVILVSLGVWGGLWGFAGMLLAVPMTVTVMIILTQFRPTRPIAVLLSDNGQIAPIRHAAIPRAGDRETIGAA
ncbi:MAG: AI-2E family transporter [Parvularculaceae bacterium]|nr:AI-2E family transporter [Parvularculaceae bacterium]